MANDTGSFGLRAARHISGSSQWQVEKMFVHASFGTAIFVGDPILVQPELDYLDTTGKHRSAAVAAGTAGTMVIGACVGIEPIQTDLNKTYLPASTGGYIYVMTAREAIYEIRGSAGATPTKVFIGENADMVATSAGSTSTGLSGFDLDETSNANTQNLTLSIYGIKDVPDNTLAASAIYLVRINTALNILGDMDGVTAT